MTAAVAKAHNVEHRSASSNLAHIMIQAALKFAVRSDWRLRGGLRLWPSKDESGLFCTVRQGMMNMGARWQ
jgi:hypothetical protein